MAFIDDGMKDKLAIRRRALLGIEENTKTIKELFVETKPSDKFESKQLDRFNSLPKDFKLALESMKITHNLPYEMSLPALLATANFGTASLIDVKMKMFEEDYVMPTHLWLLTLAGASKGKTTIFNLIGKAVREFEAQQEIRYKHEEEDYKLARAIYKKQYDSILRKTKLTSDEMRDEILFLGPEPEPPVGTDFTVPTATLNGLINSLNEVPFCRIASDEAGNFFNSHSMKKETEIEMITALSALFSGSPIGRITGIREDKTKIYDRRFSMYFLTQPENADFLNKRIYREQGFLNRVLISQTPHWRLPKMSGKSATETAKAKQLLEPFNKRVLELLNTPKQFKENSKHRLGPKAYTIDDDADKVLREFGDALDDQAQPGEKYEEYAGFVGRATEHIVRLASTFTVYQGKDTIDMCDIGCGMELYNFFLEQLINLEIGGNSKFAEEIAIGERFMKWLSGTFDKDTKHGKKGELVCPDEGRSTTWLTTKAPRFWSRDLKEHQRKEILHELVKRQQLKIQVDGTTEFFTLVR